MSPVRKGGYGAAMTESFELSGNLPPQLVESARVDARAVGYAQGWSQGLREVAAGQAAEIEHARAERALALRAQANEVATTVQALLRATARLETTVVELTDELSDRMLAAAVELATVLLGQELTDPVASARSVLNRVLERAPENQAITIWLSPADHAVLTGPDAPALLASLPAGVASRLTFELDPSLLAGDATARSAATSIDARLSSAIERLREYSA